MADDQIASTQAYYTTLQAHFFKAVHGSHLHSGYWPHGVTNDGLTNGSRRFSRYLANYIDISSEANFLDVGCGLGGPATELSRIRGCHVFGVNIVQSQIDACRELAREVAVTSKTTFCKADAHQLPHEEDSFDGAWLVESVAHMDHSRLFKELRRVLKNDAKLYIADFFTLDSASARDIRMLELMNRTWGLKPPDNLELIAQKSGFKRIGITDLTSSTINGTWTGYTQALIDDQKDLVARFGADGYARLVADFETLSPLFLRMMGYAVTTWQ